jgi:hypothetical protein
VRIDLHGPPHKRGVKPAPRHRLNPAFRRAVFDSGRPLWQLARDLGFVHQPRFSYLINAESVPATRTSISDLYRIADAVGFDQRRLFL